MNRLYALPALAGACALGVFALSVDRGTPGHAPPAPSAREVAAVESAAAQLLHIDPATGEFVAEPLSGVPLETSDLHGTSSDGLVEEPSPVAGGGVMVNLRGRFQSRSVATIGEDGRVVVECLGPDGTITTLDAAPRAEGGRP